MCCGGRVAGAADLVSCPKSVLNGRAQASLAQARQKTNRRAANARVAFHREEMSRDSP